MAFDTVWRELREECSLLDSDAVLVTPSSERPFTIESIGEDRIVIAYRDGDDERVLWRDQFSVLYERLRKSEGVAISDVPSGVEPYVSVATLSSWFAADGATLRAIENGDAGESPFLRAGWEVRTTPERVHDDALLLAEELERYDAGNPDPETMSPEELVNLYVLLSDVQHGSNALRGTVGDVLIDRIGPAGTLSGPFGTVQRTHREQRRVKAAEAVFDALEAEGIPREWVVGVDREKLDVVLAVTDLDESDVYDVEEQVYVQKTSVEEEAKRTRLQGLKDRLARADAEETGELRDEIEALEERIDERLAAD